MKETMENRTLDELKEMLKNIIDEREGVRNGTERADFLDEMYLIVDSEIYKRKAA